MRIIAKERSHQKMAGDRPTFIKSEYRRGYAIPAFPYQQGGIVPKVLWKAYDHVIRIIPGHDPVTGEIYHQNINCDSYGCEEDGSINYTSYLSDTFCKVNIVSGLGQVSAQDNGGKALGGMNLIADYAPGSEWERQYGGDTVFTWFSKNIFDSVNAKRTPKFKPIQEWFAWTNFKGPLKLVKPALLMQCLAFRLNGKFNAQYSPETGETPLISEDGSPLPVLATVVIDHVRSIDCLLQALVEPSNPGMPLDAITNNKYGGMAELDGNLLYLNSVDDPSVKDKGFKMLKPSVQEMGAGKKWNPTPAPLDEETARSLWVPWDNLLNYLTPQEQLKILATEFGADTVNYVIGMDPKFHSLRMPDEIAKAGLGRYDSGNGDTQPQGITINAIKPAVKAAKTAQPPKINPVAADLGRFNSQLNALRQATGKPAEPQDNAELAAELLDSDIEEL